MSHHTNPPICPSCDKLINQGHPKLADAWSRIKAEFPRAHISWCFRDKIDQDLFLKQGRTKAKWPNSKHNIMIKDKPCARAIDLFELSIEGKTIFSPRFYYNINEFVVKNELPLQWAGNWTEFIETDHFQLKEDII